VEEFQRLGQEFRRLAGLLRVAKAGTELQQAEGAVVQQLEAMGIARQSLAAQG